jgi:hypothetical protein
MIERCNSVSRMPGATTCHDAAAAGGEPIAQIPERRGSTFSDPVAAAMAMVAEFCRQAQKTSSDLKKDQALLRAGAEQKQADALCDKADAIMTGAIVSCAALSASAVAHGSSFGASLAENPSEPFIKLMDGSADVLTKSAELPERFASVATTRLDADAKEAESAATAAEAKSAAHDDAAKAAGQIAEKAALAIRTVLELRHAAAMAILSRRG